MPPLERVTRSLSRIKRRSAWQYRRATGPLRALPHFIVIGAQKSGTTSLFYYLSQHPQIVRGASKEVHYFDGGVSAHGDNYARGPLWYRAHFPVQSRLRYGQVTGEASPIYLFHPLCPERIHQLVPNAKLIAVLRNPTERAISHYFHQKRKGRETLPLDRALYEEDQRINPGLHSGTFDDSFRRYSYKARGRYREQLERYLRCFPREQLLILSAEELFREPGPSLARIFEFLGVETRVQSIDLSARNVASDKPDIDPRIRQYLDDYFGAENQALFKLIGKEFDWARSQA